MAPHSPTSSRATPCSHLTTASVALVGSISWACLLPHQLPFASVARLLGWQTHEAQILGQTTVRSLVRSPGQVIRRAEQAEVAVLAAQHNLASLDLQLAPHDQPRRRVGWPAEVNAALDAALAADQVCPPSGVSWGDWERVLAARRAETTCPVEELRHLGPALEPDQVLLRVDEVLTRRPQASHFLELRTARIMSAAGERYVSGVGTALLQELQVLVGLALGMLSSLLLIADGARSLRSFFTDMLSQIARKAMILDWYHLRQKCLELSRRIWGNKAAKAQLLQRLYRSLWRGDVVAAITVLEGQRREARNEAKLDELIAYLQARAPWMVNYRQRLLERHSIGSGQVETANDLIVARRQKNGGMQWSQATSDALAALCTLMLNGGWERYGQQREVLPLLAS
jgi:hypothetical protein